MERARAALSHVSLSCATHSDGMTCMIHENGCATVELNRPSAMNSLSQLNITFLYERLLCWLSDPAVTHVVIFPSHINTPNIETSRRKAFCAGGDLKEFISTDRVQFTYREYRLDCLIQQYPKPIITMIDGVAMGGGAGIACLASYRIVTPNTLFAMPEAAIGWSTDCGSSYFLSTPRVDQENGFAKTQYPIKHVGEYLVMTGTRLKARDLSVINIATHYEPDTSACHSLLQHLTKTARISTGNAFSDIEEILHNHTQPMASLESFPSILIPHKAEIEGAFSLDSAEAIFAHLEANYSEWNKRTLKTLRKQCPTILKIALQLIRRAAGLNSEECLRMEFRVGLRLQDRDDLQDGVASVLIRKDGKPSWNPSKLGAINDNWIHSCFGPSPIGLEFNVPPIPIPH